MTNTEFHPEQDRAIIAYSLLMAKSFWQLSGRTLLRPKSGQTMAQALYHAPFALVSHGTESDPIFRYGNSTAQNLWGITWKELTRMPSRLTSAPDAAAARRKLLDNASRHGFVDDYKGVRITRDGRQFMIYDTVLWNVTDAAGIRHGQAAMIPRWDFL